MLVPLFFFTAYIWNGIYRLGPTQSEAHSKRHVCTPERVERDIRRLEIWLALIREAAILPRLVSVECRARIFSQIHWPSICSKCSRLTH